MNRIYCCKKFCRYSINSFLSVLIVLFIFSFFTDNLYAQRRKGKNNKNNQVDPAAQKKAYIMELTKYWSFGFENYKNKQYNDATKHFWRVTRIDTIDKFPKIYRYLGDSYFKLGKPDSAKIVFELGLQRYPEDAYLHRMVGYISEQTEQIDAAITEYEAVVKIESTAVDDWKRLAALYVKADRIEDAIGAYDKILSIDPNDVEAQNNKSSLILSTGDIEAAIASKEKVRMQDSLNSQVRFDLGKMYFEQGSYDTSIVRFNEFLTLVPNDAGALEYIGISCQRLDRNREAIAHFKEILKQQPDNKKIMAEISRCYKVLGSFTTARTYANKALAVDRQFGLGWIALGEVYEASAEKCVNAKKGNIEFDDNLVYELAYQQYKRAVKDFEFKNEAERHINYLITVIPTNEKVFMHKEQKKPNSDCYSWIPASEFGSRFWNALNRRLGR